MNGIFIKFLLIGLFKKLYLRKPGFTYSACGSFTKYCVRIQKIKETDDLNYISIRTNYTKNTVHDAVYGASNDFTKRSVSGKVLKERAYEIALNPKYH